MMVQITFIWIIFTGLVIAYFKNVELKFTNDRSIVESEFVSYHVNPPGEEKPDTLCDIVKEDKLAICKMILEHDEFFEKHQIYFNKAASFHLEPNCEEHTLTFKYETRYNVDGSRISQKMFPCYGRHNPMRTHWQSDDFFDTVYVTGGPMKNSLFIFFHTKNPMSDVYIVLTLFRDRMMSELKPIIINEDEVQRELKSLRRLSVNSNINEIEINYLRKFVIKEMNQFAIESICNLDVEKKLWLCKLILLRDKYKMKHKWTINESDFYNHPVACEDKFIEFEHNLEYNQPMNQRKMFPCYGKPLNGSPTNAELQAIQKEFNLSGGYRDNSVIVYIRKDDQTYSFYEFIENVFLEFYKTNEMILAESDYEKLENIYIKWFVVPKIKPDLLCKLPKEHKLAICNRILNHEIFTTEMKIYLNKAAAFYSDIECVEHPVRLRTLYPIRYEPQKMFPCYGRHDTLRSDWNLDDYFETLYISGGSEDDSVLVYISEKKVTSDVIYSLHSLFTDVGIDYLDHIEIKKEEVTEELKLLKRMTYNTDQYSIEVNYIREIIEKKIEIKDHFCSLLPEEKLRLCEHTLSLLDPDWESDGDTFFSESSNHCEEKYIQFKNFDEYNDLEIKQKMFKCYGQSNKENEDIYYLAAGYRLHSAIIFKQDTDTTFVFIRALTENLNVDFCLKTKNSIKTTISIERAYVESYIEKEEKPDTLCDLSRYEKWTICKAILKNYEDIYFNKHAHFFRSVDCITRPLTFLVTDYNKYQGTEQKMFPCYGRHDPLRTSWSEDFHLNSFYISGGPEYDSLYVYIRSMRISKPIYGIFELITDAGIDNMPLINKIYLAELEEEVKSLERLSISENLREIEILYIEYVIRKRASTESDPVCNLSIGKKVSLCNTVFQNLKKYHNYWSINESMFTKPLSNKVEDKNIRFHVVPSTYTETLNVTRKIFPCHGYDEKNFNYTPVFYLCAGYRENSVLIFDKDEADPEAYKFSASIENLKLAELEEKPIELDTESDSDTSSTMSNNSS